MQITESKHLSSLLFTALFTSISSVALTGCGDPSDTAVATRSAWTEQYVEALSDPRAVSDQGYVDALTAELSSLSQDAQEELAVAIDNHTSKTQQEAASGTAGFALLQASIPVQWSWWPAGSSPSYVGTTTACGGDTDIRVYWSSVPNAYNDPDGLIIETNSIYVYGIMQLHGYHATAYNITSSNQVNVCVGLGPATGPAIQGMFATGMFIQ